MELLAPAGNLTCLHAAVDAGADAVYLGLDEFNARRNADNFTLETLREACDYAHLRGVAVYVTLNVEILPCEFARAIELARRAYLAGADALIVQDIGLAAELTRSLPQIELHISTQMNIHNAAGIEAAARLGAKRVTLARELSIAEIAHLSSLADEFGIQVECFGHGALCVCYSGQCLMSSMIGGRSANRGLCAQACRLPYELHRDDNENPLPAAGEHLLSPRDLSTIRLLDRIEQAGVFSLKIEGRMKSADYVHEVVSVYRQAFDAIDSATAIDEDLLVAWEARLAEAFSRGFTTAYLENRRGNEIMSYGRPNNRGVFAGRVTRTAEDVAEIAPEIELHPEDLLEFWTNRGHFTASIPKDADCSDSTISIPIDQRTGKGDRVFRVRNVQTAFSDDPQAPRIPISGHIELKVGRPAHIAFATDEGVHGEAWGDTVETARTKAVDTRDVFSHVNRLGQTPFTLEGPDGQPASDRFSIVLDEGVGIGFSQLHRLRNDALDELSSGLLAPYRDRTAEPIADTSPSQHGRMHRSENCEVVVWATNPGAARAAKRAGADAIFVPTLNFRRGQAQIEGVVQDTAEQAGYPKQCLMAVAAIDHDPIEGTREESLSFDPWDYVREGKTVFADSLAGALRALAMGCSVEVGPHVPLVNHASLLYAAQLDISRVWLSPELTLGQIAELAANSPIPLGLCVSGSQELMITEHCLLMSQGECSQLCEVCARRQHAHHLRDRKGFEFPVVTDLLGRSHLYNGIELDLTASLPDLIDSGITAIMVDTTLMAKKDVQAAVSRVIRARDLAVSEHRSAEKRPGTTTGHLFRGVS